MDRKTTQNEEQRRTPQTLVRKCLFFWWLSEIRIYRTCFVNLRYVLLKEKNMLLTLQQESRRQRIQMPSPERIRKVSLIYKTPGSSVEMHNYIWVALVLCSWARQRFVSSGWKVNVQTGDSGGRERDCTPAAADRTGERPAWRLEEEHIWIRLLVSWGSF